MFIPLVYAPLESDITSTIGGGASFNTASAPSFFTTSSFLFTFAFVIIVVTASFRYAYAGMLRLPATQESIKKSKDEFTRVTYGLLGVFALWLILFTVNKDMLSGEVTLSGLKATPGTGTIGAVVPTGTTPGSGTSKACESEVAVKAALTAGNVCGGVTCTMSGCLSSNQYIGMIKSEAGADWKMALVILCKESGGQKDATHKNENGSWDCGLMQKNMPLGKTCASDNILDPLTNIHAGVAAMKQTISANNQTYPGIPSVAGVFSAYNCCANGTAPNSPSASCTSANGWPSVPKWACPIDPGTAAVNMCGVKAYACELTACLNSL